MNRPAFFVGPCDLSRELACVPRSPADGTVLLVESEAQSRSLPFHAKKLVLTLSASHHFAEELRAAGYEVELVSAPTYADGIRRHVAHTRASEIHALLPREWGMLRSLWHARDALGAPLIVHDDGGPGGHFLLRREEFAAWARGSGALRFDQFYSFMRRRTGWLMEDGRPVGGKYTIESEGKDPPRHVRPPPALHHEPDELTRRVMERVEASGPRYGSVQGFEWPVTRAQALAEMEAFFARRARDFGRYADRMLSGQRFLWHSRLAVAMNIGLLGPRELCERAVLEHRRGRMPLPSVETLLRCVCGWREYVRGVYWLRMPGLREANALDAHAPLPRFYSDPELTRMRCARETAAQVLETGYAHHNQRLMVLGNFALLAGVEPSALSRWFWASFVDGCEWSALPNTHGLALHADPGFTSKPYAASGSYIAKTSDYCRRCPYDPKRRTGPDACPYNPLFWVFLERNRGRLAPSGRLAALYHVWDRWSERERTAIRETARRVLSELAPEEAASTEASGATAGDDV